MKALICTHVETEGPGTIGTFLAEAGVESIVRRLYRGEPLPDDPGEVDLAVVMGGPMNVYDDLQFPFLAEETRWLAAAARTGLPVIGICLGAQLIARSLGAKVYRAPVKEVGWGEVTLTDAGRRDPLFGGLPPVMPVLQWHEDTFDLPPGAPLLAESPLCRHQAFRAGSMWGLQFHLEVDGPTLAEWFGGEPEGGDIVATYERIRTDFDFRARGVWERFLAVARKGRRAAGEGSR